MHPYREFVNPHLGELLEKVRMDKRFVRGSGTELWDAEGKRYLDFVAAYGSLPFGFNPPEIWAALNQIQQTGEPSFVQPAALEAAGELARRLVKLTPAGLDCVTFTNSGAEATEAALKLVRSATGRHRILATHGSFHGKTMGALSATGRPSYQEPFGLPIDGFDFVAYGDAAALEEALGQRPGEYAAVILEPIQGEGGIVMPPADYLRQAKTACEEHGTLLILDEVQTGLGRTGWLFACEQAGITPDVMLLAKALGGGLFPIGACLSTGDVYTEDFGLKHSSTFAGNTLACRAGLAALELLTDEDRGILRNVQERGQQLRTGLETLQSYYPHIIGEVRGRGLMMGIDFAITRKSFGTNAGAFLGVMAEQELLTPVISSYMLNAAGVRFAPTLNGSSVVRIEPPLTVTAEECDEALAAVEQACRIMSQGNTGALLAHLVSRTQPVPALPNTNGRRPSIASPTRASSEGRFAFLVHALDLDNYPEFDESLRPYSLPELDELTERFSTLLDPFVAGHTRIESKTGAQAYGEFIAIPRTTHQLLTAPRQESLELVEAAVALAQERGAKIVGLGAYTAIVSRGGRALTGVGLPLTTGNSYTVVAAIEALQEASSRLGQDLSQVTAAIVGATGSIGRGTALLLSEKIERLLLVGNPRSGAKAEQRLLRVAGEVYQRLAIQAGQGHSFAPGTIGDWLMQQPGVPGPDADLKDFADLALRLNQQGDAPIEVTTDVAGVLPRSQMVMIATSTGQEFITPELLRAGAVVCDMSRPPNVSRKVDEQRRDVLVLDGGVIEVPGRPWFGWNFGYEQGLAYACMSETMMLALEHRYENTSLGSDLTPESMLEMRALGRKHGFQLAGLRSFDRPVDDARWQQLITARQEVMEQVRM